MRLLLLALVALFVVPDVTLASGLTVASAPKKSRGKQNAAPSPAAPDPAPAEPVAPDAPPTPALPTAEPVGGTTGSVDGIAVMPVQVRVADVRAREGSVLLTNVLTTRLDELGDYRVISADEVAELLKNEAERQNLGCADDNCLAEIAGALGARYLVTGEIAPLGKSLLWSAALVDQTNGTAVRRASVNGRDMQSLLAQVDEVAAALGGKQQTAELQGATAQLRFGFHKRDDLARFKEFRESRTDLSTTEALTQFLIDANAESIPLAIGETVAFSVAAGSLVAIVPLVFLGQSATSLFLAGPTLLAGLGLMAVIPLGVTAGLIGMGLVVYDGLNRGHVTVSQHGCCRREADLHDAQTDEALTRALAMVVFLGGPTALSVAMLMGVVASLSVQVMLTSGALPTRSPGNTAIDPLYFAAAPLYFTGLLVGLGLMLLVPIINTVVGGLLLWWPSPEWVADGAPPPTPEGAR